MKSWRHLKASLEMSCDALAEVANDVCHVDYM